MPAALSSAPPAPIPARVASFRARYRAAHIGRHYNGRLHFTVSVGLSFTAVALCLATLRAPSWRDWLVLPAAFVVANGVEYLAHRFPMHRPWPALRIVYQRHTQMHHHFYTHEAMACESLRDFHMILFPAVLLVFFLGAIAVPLSAAVYLLLGADAARLFAAVAIGYYGLYELFHTTYHLPLGHWAWRVPGMAHLRQLHTSHHNQANMMRYNFNITLPLFDKLLGTYKRDW